MTEQKTKERERKKPSKRKKKKKSARRKPRTRDKRKGSLIERRRRRIEERRGKPKPREEEGTKGKVPIPKLSLLSRTEEEDWKLASKSGLEGLSERNSIPLPIFSSAPRTREERRTKLIEGHKVEYAGLKKIIIPSFETADREREKWTRKISQSVEKDQERTLFEIPRFEIESGEERERRVYLKEISPVEGEEGVEREEKAHTTAKTSEAGAGVSGGEGELDFYDFFLEFSGSKQPIVDPENPVAIVVAEKENESFKRTMQHICRDVYRERVGGLPSPEGLSQDNKRKIERELTEDKILAVEEDLSSAFLTDGFKAGIKKIEKKDEKIADQIQDFYSQNLGFLLLPVQGEEKAKRFTETLKENVLPEMPYIILVRQKIGGDLKEKISRCAWGFRQIDVERNTLDSYFLAGERSFKDQLMKLKGTSYWKETEKDPHPEIRESPTHLYIKAFVVKHLADKRNLGTRKKLRKSDIETEPGEVKEVEEGTIRPDIIVENKKKCYEVETLFGEAISPEDEIGRKIELYYNSGYELNFVLPNLTFLRYFPFLKEEQEFWKNEGYPIGFYTLDLEMGKLASLDDVEDYIDTEIRPFVARPES